MRHAPCTSHRAHAPPRHAPFRTLVAALTDRRVPLCVCPRSTIFPLLANVVQFTRGELDHIKQVQELERSTTTASGILSSFFQQPQQGLPSPTQLTSLVGSPLRPHMIRILFCLYHRTVQVRPLNQAASAIPTLKV